MKAYLVAGLGFGDEGKGTIVDALVREHGAPLVVRYNGGAQAAHHVVDDRGRSHCFSQFGSGTLAGAQTYLSKYVTVDIPALGREAAHLQEMGIKAPLGLVSIDPEAPIVTPHHRGMNQLREIARGRDRHGSCGLGIGEVARMKAFGQEVLTWADVQRSTGDYYKKLTTIRDRLVSEAEALGFRSINHPAWNLLDDEAWDSAWYWSIEQVTHAMRRDGRHRGPREWNDTRRPIVFEGAQGVLLDEWRGFHPYTTWSTTTFENALALLNEHVDDFHAERIGVTRCFHTRHGAGPFPSEARYLQDLLDDEHNKTNPWQTEFRVGALDLVLLHYAIRACGGVDSLAVTHLDKVQRRQLWPIVESYLSPTQMPIGAVYPGPAGQLSGHVTEFLNTLSTKTTYLRGDAEAVIAKLRTLVPVSIVSYGPKASDKRFLKLD